MHVGDIQVIHRFVFLEQPNVFTYFFYLDPEFLSPFWLWYLQLTC